MARFSASLTSFCLACMVASAAAPVYANNGPSDLSAATSMAIGSVVLAPVSLIVGGSHAVGASFAEISAALDDNTSWTIVGITAQGEQTQLALRSADNKTTLTLAISATQAQKSGLQLGAHVEAKRLGQHSFELRYHNQPLGVVADDAVGLVRSKKRD